MFMGDLLFVSCISHTRDHVVFPRRKRCMGGLMFVTRISVYTRIRYPVFVSSGYMCQYVTIIF